jgi:NADH:ubiquinone oxidoreductase subunit 3 (subunit A)
MFYFIEYLHILYYFLFIIFFVFLLSFVSFLFDFLFFVKGIVEFEKVSSYECGFQPFSDARSNFDIRFYLVAILFIIFDLEIVFLLPWSIVFQDLGSLGFWSVITFLVLLTIGFLYEWVKGALDWQ